MSLPLTPETLRAAYEFLCTTPPFKTWNLPDGEDVVFRVTKDRNLHGGYYRIGKKHCVEISGRSLGHTHMLIEVMAHEMVHVHEGNIKVDRKDVQHSLAFKRWAAQVCKIHGFDPKSF